MFALACLDREIVSDSAISGDDVPTITILQYLLCPASTPTKQTLGRPVGRLDCLSGLNYDTPQRKLRS